jgi:hypothetical protein
VNFQIVGGLTEKETHIHATLCLIVVIVEQKTKVMVVVVHIVSVVMRVKNVSKKMMNNLK